MLAIVAAVIFAIGLIIDLADANLGIGSGVFVFAGLLCLSLHMAGVGVGARGTNRRWSMRR